MKLTVDDVLSLDHVRTMNVAGVKRTQRLEVSTDSRTAKPGSVFFAIRGEKFDGHQYIDEAFEAGAVIAVVDQRCDPGVLRNRPAVVVNDATAALGQLANRYRRKFSIPVLAIAGSNGKTTTKDMVADVLSEKYSVLKTEGNHNNHIGVPQTLFRMAKNHDVAVLELGTNHPGELARLCTIVEPTHGLITNIGREHLEFFRDLEGVAKEESSLFDSLAPSGTAFVNADDAGVAAKAKKLRKRVTYGFGRNRVRVHGRFLALDENGRGSLSVRARGKRGFLVQLSVPGRHLVGNALAASAVGLALRVSPKSIQTSLRRFSASSKRMEVRIVRGVTIIDDTYNANPESMLAALETLHSMHSRGKKIAVLADMLELGKQSMREHQAVGENVGVDCLLTFGRYARAIHESASAKTKFHYDQKNVLSEYLAELVTPGDIVLVKGSHGMAMEDVVTFLVERLNQRQRMSRTA